MFGLMGEHQVRVFHQMTFGLVPHGSGADDPVMAYIIERNNRFYVVAYDGIDPLTGPERRRWHPAGRSRADAEAIATTLAVEAVEAVEAVPPPDVSTFDDVPRASE